MPTFEAFCDRLTREQLNLTQLDTMTGSKMKALVARTSTRKSKQKPKHNPNSAGSESSSKPPPKSNARTPSQKGNTSKSGESSSKTKKYIGLPCNFCGKEGHLVSKCWKHLEALVEALH